MSARIEQDRRHSLDRAKRKWESLPDLPTPRMAKVLDQVLHAAFLDTQAKAHEHSGALLASGRAGSSNWPGDSWLGRVAYGGTPGTEQAIYEVSLGGEHDFLRDLHKFDPLFEAAIVNGINEELR